MNDQSPCKDCQPPKRQQGCHVYCEEGLAWEAQQKEEKEKIDKVKRANKVMDDHKIKVYAKAKRKYRK